MPTSHSRTLAMNLAARMLAGAGVAALTAYRTPGQRTIEAAQHGLDAAGQLHIMCAAGERFDAPTTDVRIDIHLAAPEFDVRITAASAHILGTVRWGASNGAWVEGIVELDTIHVHHIGTPQSFSLAVVAPVALGLGEADVDRVGAHDIAAAEDLSLVALVASAGLLPGEVGAAQPLHGCHHLHMRTFLADVSSVGVTLIHTGSRTQQALFVPFVKRARTLKALSRELRVLTRRALEVGAGYATS